MKEVLTALLVVFLLLSSFSSLSFSLFSFVSFLSSYCLLKVVVVPLLFGGSKRPPDEESQIKHTNFERRRGFLLCFAHAVFLSFFFFFFVVIQMTVWYADKSIQNIILNENYIINKSNVVTGAVFLRRREKSGGSEVVGACYAG